MGFGFNKILQGNRMFDVDEPWNVNVSNNLEALIKSSGKTKREIAQLKGVTPETLSRHIHGKIDMSIGDAEDYARILQTTVLSVLFANIPIKIIGKTFVHKDETVTRKTNKDGFGWAHVEVQHWQNMGCVVWGADPDYNGPWRCLAEAWQLFDMKDTGRRVSISCYHSMCYVELEHPIEIAGRVCEHLIGVVYPEPEGTFAVKINQEENKDVFRGLTPVRAYPLTTVLYRPDLRGGKIIWNSTAK